MSYSHYRIISTGLAMFSMFFGAGNVIFPLVVGQTTGAQTPFAVAGLLLTAVGVPFMGLFAILLFQGKYEHFFSRLGKFPGFLLASTIMLLIGPFGGLPRCVALSYSTLKVSYPFLSFGYFSMGAFFLIFISTFKKNRILDILGTLLTPLLLISLFVIVMAGLLNHSQLPPSKLTAMEAFNFGVIEGYNTMDLLASFFFSSIIFSSLKSNLESKPTTGENIVAIAFKSSLIGAGLLSLVYVGFSFIGSSHGNDLLSVNQGELLGALTIKLLGPYAGLFAAVTIALACLTTAIALAAVFAEFLQNILLNNRISYLTSLSLTLITSYAVSTIEFTGIVTLLAPLLQVAYPALIVFTSINIWLKLKEKSLKVVS